MLLGYAINSDSIIIRNDSFCRGELLRVCYQYISRNQQHVHMCVWVKSDEVQHDMKINMIEKCRKNYGIDLMM